MKLTSATFRNFRRFKEFTLELNSPSFNVIIGDNGSGKTSLLDGLACLLGSYFIGSDFVSHAPNVHKSDARYEYVEDKIGKVQIKRVENFRKEVYLTATAEVATPNNDASSIIEWQRNCGDRGGLAQSIRQLGQEHRSVLAKQQRLPAEGESFFCLPLFCYYGAGRLNDTHRDKKSTNELRGMRLEASQAYRYCLSPKYDEKTFLSWVEELSLQKLEAEDSKLLALTLLEEVITACVPSSTKFHYSYKERTCLLTLENGEVVRFSDLSSGYRSQLLMVGDIARRAMTLNPHLKHDLFKKQTGVILIDELEVQLHPRWQQTVVDSLKKAFPSLQFIATTYSPLIVQSLEPNELIDLRTPKAQTTDEELDNDYGFKTHSVEELLENRFALDQAKRSQHYQELWNVAMTYFKLLETSSSLENNEEKERLSHELDRLIAPYATSDVAFHAYLEMKRLAKGID